jgi:DNA (cytosine-5)-methyltransferase 1
VPEVRLQVVSQPTVISTFAGCGGSSLGYRLAGFRELLAVEWDENAVLTFRLNFPDVPVWKGDIAKLTGAGCMRFAGIKAGELDVLDGSPPCQGFSTAGKRKFSDPRNSLFKEFARLLSEIQPKVFVMENVTGLIRGVMQQVYLQIVKTLREAGYRVKGEVMNAMYFNVPQSRKRVIIIGVRNDLGIEPSHPKPSNKPATLREALCGVQPSKEKVPIVTPLRLKRWSETRRGDAHRERFSLLRCSWNKPSPTILKVPGSGGHFHPDEPRLLTIDELKACASFPESFRFHGGWLCAVERIGNSVPPNLMKAIAEHIKIEILKCPD